MLSIITRYIVILFLSLYLIFSLLNRIGNNSDSEPRSFITWMSIASHSGHETENFQHSISLLPTSDPNNTSVGSAFFTSFIITSLSLLLIWLIVTLLNTLLIRSPRVVTSLAALINNTLELLSGLHVLVYGLILYIMFGVDVNSLVIMFVIGVGSNIYFDLSSEQRLFLHAILEKDYVLNARATGDSVLKHIFRPVGVFTIAQLLGSWPTVLTNAIFIEIVFQRYGIGSLLYQNIFAPGRKDMFPEVDILMYVSGIVIVSILLVSLLKELFMLQLRDDR